MKLSVINISGQAKGEVEFADELLVKDGKGTQAVHDTVTAYMANQRLGTASTKQISEVHGSGKKPWKQKGTGRSAGPDVRVAFVAWWRCGVRAEAARLHDQRPEEGQVIGVPQGVERAVTGGDVVVVDELKLANHKTKDFAGIMATIGAKNHAPTLIVTDQVDRELEAGVAERTECPGRTGRFVNVYELPPSRRSLRRKPRSTN